MKKFSLKDTKAGKILGAKGLYITIGACVLALGGAGAAAYSRAVSDISDSLSISQSDSSSTKQADNKVSNAPKDNSSNTSSDLDTKTQPNIMPVSGDILNPFSNGELVKSETLGIWKTHDGVDIKADAGTQVKAMNKGKVTKIWDDPLWGGCITIDHGNGVVGHYYSMTKEMNVSEGDYVDSGDIIGAVGDTAEVEVAELSHLHFGLKKNGEWIDPIEYIDPSSK